MDTPKFDYEAAKEEIAALGIKGLTKDVIFSFKDNAQYYDLYNEYYQNCQAWLSKDEEIEGIAPAKMFFSTYYSVNAAAIKDMGYYLVCVNMGLMNNLYEFFGNVRKVFEESEELHHYSSLPFYDVLDFVMRKAAFEFIFFHERAHLIQFHNRPRFIEQERMSAQPNLQYSEQKHVQEMDADSNAVLKMYSGMRVDFLAQPKEYQTADIFFHYLCITVSSILLYFYRLHGSFGGIYYKKYTHPHSAIRIGYILHQFLTLLEIDPTLDFKPNKPYLRSQIHRICKYGSGFDPDVMQVYKYDYSVGMNAYLKELAEASKKYPYLLVERMFPGDKKTN